MHLKHDTFIIIQNRIVIWKSQNHDAIFFKSASKMVCQRTVPLEGQVYANERIKALRSKDQVNVLLGCLGPETLESQIGWACNPQWTFGQTQ